MTLDELLAFPPSSTGREGVASPDLSPDGTQAVYTLGGEIRRLDLAGQPLPPLGEGSAPRWCPDGSGVAFLRGAPAQLWFHDADGPQRQLTHYPHGIADFAWSPGGRQLAVIGPLDPPPPLSAGPQAATSTIVRLPNRRLHRQGVWLLDLAGGEMRLVARSAPGISWSAPAWSPDCGRLAVLEDWYAATSGSGQDPLAVIHLESGAVDHPLRAHKRVAGAPHWSPDGTRLALPHSPHERLHPFRFACGIVPAEGGEVTNLAGDYFVRSLCWHPGGRSLFACAAQGLATQVLQVDTTTGAVRPLTAQPGVHEHLRPSPDGKGLLCTYRTPTTLPELLYLSADGGERRQLTRVSDRLQSLRLAPVELRRWSAPGGTPVEGVLVKPPGYRRGRRYPAIVDLHGGPVAHLATEFHPEWHFLAAHGYLVFAPDFSGSQLYGWCPAPGFIKQDFADVMAGVDRLVADGIADPKRLGLRGFSYGARLGVWTLGHTRRFQAAVISNGWYHEELNYGGAWGAAGNPPQEEEFGGKPWEVPEVYRRFSPLTYVPQARTPTQLLQSELDGTLQAELVFTWLTQLGVETEMFVYMGEGHVIRRPEHRADAWQRTLRWFERHLRGQ
jgi:dipeptidyl aminopeptidase/acylaminoacyl peptidase